MSWGTTAITDNNPETKMERRHTETLILIQMQSEQIEATPPVAADHCSSSPDRTSTFLCQKKNSCLPSARQKFYDLPDSRNHRKYYRTRAKDQKI